MTPAQTCATCRFWQRQGARIADAERDPSCPAEHGICRAAPPVVAPASGFPVSLFPRTHQDRWCGGWHSAGVTGPDGGVVIELRKEAA